MTLEVEEFSALTLFQYLRVVLWLIGQGLLPEQPGKYYKLRFIVSVHY